MQKTLPTGNTYPGSLYLIRKIMDVKDISDYEHHVCVNDDWVWNHLPRKDWKLHANDTCPHCNAKRFRLTNHGLKPQRHFYYFGVKYVCYACARVDARASACMHVSARMHRYIYMVCDAASTPCILSLFACSCIMLVFLWQLARSRDSHHRRQAVHRRGGLPAGVGPARQACSP